MLRLLLLAKSINFTEYSLLDTYVSHNEFGPLSAIYFQVMKNNSNYHILITDDEKFLLKSLAMQMRRLGWQISTASDGNEALQKLVELHDQGETVDLILFDLTMPGLSGIELLKKLREAEQKVKMIAMSGNCDEATRDILISHGCREILVKPFLMKDLVEITERVMNGQECSSTNPRSQ